ncbi:MAG: hypothetical protein ACYDEJ_16660 [Desulfitobacteriaceae bacterium]
MRQGKEKRKNIIFFFILCLGIFLTMTDQSLAKSMSVNTGDRPVDSQMQKTGLLQKSIGFPVPFVKGWNETGMSIGGSGNFPVTEGALALNNTNTHYRYPVFYLSRFDGSLSGLTLGSIPAPCRYINRERMEVLLNSGEILTGKSRLFWSQPIIFVNST